jgi:hypothetical protein
MERRPLFTLVPGSELDNLVPGDTFTIAAAFPHLPAPSDSAMSVWPQLQSLDAGDAVELTGAAWDGNRMVFTLSAREPGTSSLHVNASASGYVARSSLTVKVHEHAAGGETCDVE